MPLWQKKQSITMECMNMRRLSLQRMSTQLMTMKPMFMRIIKQKLTHRTPQEAMPRTPCTEPSAPMA